MSSFTPTCDVGGCFPVFRRRPDPLRSQNRPLTESWGHSQPQNGLNQTEGLGSMFVQPGVNLRVPCSTTPPTSGTTGVFRSGHTTCLGTSHPGSSPGPQNIVRDPILGRGVQRSLNSTKGPVRPNPCPLCYSGVYLDLK